MTKPTKAQMDLLRDISRQAESVVRAYRPAVTLVKAGLARDLTPDDDYQIRLEITEAGQAALSKEAGHGE